MTPPIAKPAVERRHREAALRVAKDALGCRSSDDKLPDRIEEWVANTPGSPIDVAAAVWLGTLSEALADAEHAASSRAGQDPVLDEHRQFVEWCVAWAADTREAGALRARLRTLLDRLEALPSPPPESK